MPPRKSSKHYAKVAELQNQQDYQPPLDFDEPKSNRNLSTQTNGAVKHPTDPTKPPMTPPRPRSMYDSPSMYDKDYNGQSSGKTPGTASPGKKNRRSSKAQKHRQSDQINGTTQPTSNNSRTPRRTSATPSQAYAGPTFHASPAPSALPMPKFFSKSVPEVNKTPGLASIMGNETSEKELSQESSEDSPLQENAERVQQPPREESPLDIFFRADREEKARARNARSESPLSGEPLNGRSAQIRTPISGSPLSKSPLPARHHSRHNTGGSTSGLFPIEMEDETVEDPNTPTKHSTRLEDLSRAANESENTLGVSDGIVQDETARRNANSLALKRLLMSPKSEQPKSSPSEPSKTPIQPSKSKTVTPKQDSAGPFAPTPKSGTEVRILSRNQPPSLPQLQEQFGSTPTQSACSRPRPPSSNLRQQLSVPPSPAQDGLPELPSTPTPSRSYGTNSKPTTQNVHNPVFSSLRSAAFQGNGSSRDDRINEKALAEDTIRRILKLDVLGSDGAGGV